MFQRINMNKLAMKRIYDYICQILKRLYMWFASEMSRASAKNRKTNIISPLIWPIYVPIIVGFAFIGFGIPLHPDIVGDFLIFIGVIIVIVGCIIVLKKYYNQYDTVYKDDKSLLNSEGTNIEHELIKTMGQTGIPLESYKLRLPESEYLQEYGKEKHNEREEELV